MKKPVIIGVGGPVGSGKTLLIERITRLAKMNINLQLLLMIFIPRKMLNF